VGVFVLLGVAGPAAPAFADGCRHADVVFYTSDSQRLAQRLAANASPCADYYVSVMTMADGLTPRAIASLIRANGPHIHAVAEVHLDPWRTWIVANGKSWFEAGVDERRRMTAAGYDVSAGDTWAINELGPTSQVGAGVLPDTGTSRADVREFVRGLATGDGTPSPGIVFVADPLHVTTDLAQYRQQLQDFLGDTPFWNDMAQSVRFWGQEVYADARVWGVAGAELQLRTDELNAYLQHAFALAEAGPGSVSAARSFLEATYTPVGNASWPKVSGFGYTNIPAPTMEAFIASQTYAIRSYSAATAPAGQDRFGFAWVPTTNIGIPSATYVEILDHLANAIHGSDSDPAGACAASACDGTVDGASFNDAWNAFAAWSPPTNTPEGTDVQVEPAGGVAVTFASVDSRGSTQATTSASGSPPPPGFHLQAGSIYYDLETTALYTGPIDVCIGYGSSDYTGLTPRLFHLADAVWRDASTTLERATQTVCGRAGSLSPFVVFAADPPTIAVPAAITVPATSPAGATVDFSVTATSPFDSGPTVECAPTSGSLFPIGTSTVACIATDAGGNHSSASFPVTVEGAAEQLVQLSATTADDAGSLPHGIRTALLAKLDAALDRIDPSDRAAGHRACVLLDAYGRLLRNAVTAGLVPTQTAAPLLADAERIGSVLDC
jgi:hypothetical protein